MSEFAIEVNGLTKKYRQVTAVQELSFSVLPGRVTGFLGPNGSGKTTTLRMLLDLVTPTAGTATIGGCRYRDLTDPVRVVGAVLDASAAHHGRTGRDHLRVLCATAGLPAGRVDQVLDLVGLTAAGKRRFKGYSLGMRQRLGIAAALIGNPRVLILDEPANGLDPEGIYWLRTLLRGLAAGGCAVLVSSHLLSEMEQLAEDIVIIAKGQLVRQGSVGEVVESIHARAAAQVQVRAGRPDVLTATLVGVGATVTSQADRSLLVAGADAATVSAVAARAGVTLYELTTERPDLEQAFLALTSGKADLR